MTELGPAGITVTVEDLRDRYSKEITRMISDELESDVDTERLTQVAMALRNTLYWGGKQYVVPRYDGGTGAVEFIPVPDNGNKVKFSACYNIYKSDGIKFIGAVSPRAPNVKALPDDDESQDDISAADKIDGLIRMLRRKWETNRRQKELAHEAWVTGPVFAYQAYVADGHKYGWTEEPEMGVEQVEGPDGGMVEVPQMQGTKRYPNGDVELALYNVLYVTVPPKAEKIQQCEWLRCEFLEHKARLKALYGDALKDYEQFEYDNSSSGSASSERALEAQQTALSFSGENHEWRKSYWRWTRYWIRPNMYVLLKGSVRADDGETSRKLADILTEQFPDGLRIAVVNGKIVEVSEERMDEVWTACRTGLDKRILSDPWGADMIPIQDDENDFRNMAKEIILRSIPKTFVASNLIDRTKISDNDPEIAEVIQVKIAAGEDIRRMMGEMPMARMSDALVPYMNNARERGREISNVTEALFGGGDPSQTYRGEKQRRDQSMMAFAPFFDETQSFWEATYTNGVKQLLRYGTGTVKVPGEDGTGSQLIDLAAISEGGWHVEAEEGMPMSHAEEVDRLLFLLNENNPEIVAKLGVLDPSNAIYLHKYLGLRGFKAPEELARNKAQNDIQRLLAEQPITDVDPLTGETVEKPSIPVDEYEDDPVIFDAIYTDWCLASQGDRDTNPAGYANVRARGKEYRRMAIERQMPPPMPGDGPPPDGGPPPPGGPPPGPPGPPPPMEGKPAPFDTAPPF